MKTNPLQQALDVVADQQRLLTQVVSPDESDRKFWFRRRIKEERELNGHINTDFAHVVSIEPTGTDCDCAYHQWYPHGGIRVKTENKLYRTCPVILGLHQMRLKLRGANIEAPDIEALIRLSRGEQ